MEDVGVSLLLRRSYAVRSKPGGRPPAESNGQRPVLQTGESVAKAIDIASLLSWHEALAFASARIDTESFVSGQVPTSFRLHVNEFRHVTGLPEIPDEHVSPQMFRRILSA